MSADVEVLLRDSGRLSALAVGANSTLSEKLANSRDSNVRNGGVLHQRPESKDARSFEGIPRVYGEGNPLPIDWEASDVENNRILVGFEARMATHADYRALKLKTFEEVQVQSLASLPADSMRQRFAEAILS